MPDDLMPEDLRDFFLGHIDSIVQLEALLLLRRNPNEDWDAAKTAKRLYTSGQEVADVLARLCADGRLSSASLERSLLRRIDGQQPAPRAGQARLPGR